MSNIDKQALRDSAESTINILENIAGFEPSDIDGDTVELRFETEDGFDTGCDVSIVDQCQKAADVVQALLDELEAKDKRITELEAKLETADKLQDSSFRHGLQHGFSLGQTDNQAGFEQAIHAYGQQWKGE
ncbi:ead/Ea22-like family protein [Enterobacter hormaechei subsp. hoffmannii]|nr:ead/Ea22-like family protein [Enterobacter hormaechei subsp. hoffmannii]